MNEDYDSDIQELPVTIPTVYSQPTTLTDNSQQTTSTDNSQQSNPIDNTLVEYESDLDESVRQRHYSDSGLHSESLAEKDKKKWCTVWTHYKEIVSDGISYAKCIHCKNTKYKLSGKANAGTGNLTRHVAKNHKEKIIISGGQCESQKRLDAMFSAQYHIQKAQDYAFVQDTFRQKMLTWIVHSDQPYTAVERPSFIEMIKYLNPTAVSINADSIKNDLMSTVEKMRSQLNSILKDVPGKIYFTHDAWTSPNNIGFMAIMAHWITNSWDIRDVLLDFPNLIGRHTGEKICEVFRKSILTFNIGLEKVYAITTDNATNNDTFFQQLEAGSTVDGISQFIESESRVRCSAHVLNLVIQTLLSNLSILPVQNDEESEFFVSEDETDCDQIILDDLNYVSHLTAITKLRKLFRGIRKSVRRREKLKQACDFYKAKEYHLIIDVKTRWNSTFFMIKRALSLKLPIVTMCSTDKNLKIYLLSEEEWSALETVNVLLEKFDRATQHFSMARHPAISSVIPMYDWLKTELKKFIESQKGGPLSLVVPKALDKLMQYKPDVQNSQVLFLAVVFRPSLKLNYFKENPVLYDNKSLKQIKTLVIQTFENHYELADNSADLEKEADDLDDDFYQYLSKRSRKTKAQFEIQTYLTAPLASPKASTLDWWSVHSLEFPNVARMAMDILATQATSVPVEREFSGGMDLVVPTRHRLSPSTITASMCLKS